MTKQQIKGVLFDLDGTLAYSAAELGLLANQLRQQQQLPALAISAYETVISDGVNAILEFAINLNSYPQPQQIVANYLQSYQQLISRQAGQLYPQVAQLLQQLQQRQIPWGIVTNKHSRFTAAIIATTPELSGAQACISGDSLAVSKPQPEPLLAAASQLQLAPQQCLYLGDHLRDMQAAQAANMLAVYANYGYSPLKNTGQTIANHVINTPLELLKLL